MRELNSESRNDGQERGNFMRGNLGSYQKTGRTWTLVASLPKALCILGLGFVSLALSGCQSNGPKFTEVAAQPSSVSSKSTATKPDVIVLHEGDTVRISFPGAPSLNTVQQIRRDGRVTLPEIGELKAVGFTPPELEKEILKEFGSQLQTKEVTVSVESSAFPIYVSGAVLKPGKVLSDRPLTALEAIMEAGGFDTTRANMKKVRVIRTENGQTQHFTLDLKGVLQGSQTDQFKLKPEDIIYVPERFSWF